MTSHTISDYLSPIATLLKQKDGPLTRDLLREPGQFGLGQVPERLRPDAITRVVCGYCSTGCGLNVHMRSGEALNLSPSSSYPVNQGTACPKGWEALTPLSGEDRGVTPLIRESGGAVRSATWVEAIQALVDRFRAVSEAHGPAAMAFLSTGQIVTEEMFCLGVLAKFGMGMVHGDGNTRQCMATAVAAYKQAFGFDAPPYTYADFEASDVIVLVGSNLCIAHPIMWERICRNRSSPAIIVIDPRTTETAMAATEHLAIRPKSDLLLFYAVAWELIAQKWLDLDYLRDHVEGFEAFREFVKDRGYSPEGVAQTVGIEADRIRALAKTIYQGKSVSFWWTMGVNQGHQAVRTAQAIINVALMTGNIGRPGTGANSITGQCNAMGSRLFSNTTCLPAGRDFTNEKHRQEVAEALGIEVDRISDQVSLAYDQILEGVREGKIRALWVIATNGAHSWIHQHEAKETLKMLDVLVVQDMYANTETAQLADIYLPAAGWGEKDGTFINSERRLGLIKRIRKPPGQALTDYNIFRLVAEAWGCGPLLSQWPSPEDVFQVMKDLSRDTPCDFSGIGGYRDLEVQGGIQWPCPSSTSGVAVDTERRLFEDGQFYRKNGRALMWFDAHEKPNEEPDEQFPFVLITGRGSSSEWHTQTRTRTSAVLAKLHRDPKTVDVHPVDAARLGIVDQMPVTIRSRRGEISGIASVNATVKPGELFVSMHGAEVNQLTYPSFDPWSRQPSYKYCAVALASEFSKRP
ncbi:MAG: molybdopterin-dependent oxidoreductase [Myxococcales bacterium]|nr:molybdopterin-dependent oxidoreductase [Myxococcales bacterium]